MQMLTELHKTNLKRLAIVFAIIFGIIGLPLLMIIPGLGLFFLLVLLLMWIAFALLLYVSDFLNGK